MQSRLDVLLELMREAQPSDDDFVAGVMERARVDDLRHSRRRRMLTGPAAFAAASLIVVGGAVAALMRSTAPPPIGTLDTAQESSPAVRPAPGAVEPAPSLAAEAKRPGPSESSSYREGDSEWGYASDTTAYAIDHDTGLRLETQIYRSEFDTDVPQRVTLTLENTGDKAIAVTAPEGCALMVAAYPAEEGDGSTPERSDDGREAYPWQCAAAEEDSPRAPQERETFVLGPGRSRVAEATVVLGASGDWAVVGMCQCSYEPARRSPTPDPPAGDNPLDRIRQSGPALVGLPTPQSPNEPADERLVTPPIRVKVS